MHKQNLRYIYTFIFCIFSLNTFTVMLLFYYPFLQRKMHFRCLNNEKKNMALIPICLHIKIDKSEGILSGKEFQQYFYWQSILIQTTSRPNNISHRKVDFNQFVQNYLCCDMGMIIFDLHGYGGCQRPKMLQRAHTQCLVHPTVPVKYDFRSKLVPL